MDSDAAKEKMITAAHVDNAIAMALAGEAPNLDPAVLDILGFATPTMRRMFSNLCGIPGLTYLQCGVYCGASFLAAANNNPIQAIGIDNFSQTWHPDRQIRAEFLANKERFAPSSVFLEGDCFAPAVFGGNVDVFFFDANHSREDQARALPRFFDLLASSFLFIVDDWNWSDVDKGTMDGFNTVGPRFSIERDWILRGEKGQDDPIWHNGVALFLCHKK